MGDIQIITKNWKAEIEGHINAMEKTHAETFKYAPGPEFSRLFDVHESVCHDFVSYMQTYFGSAQGFVDFLHADIQGKLTEANLSTSLAGPASDWIISTTGVAFMALQAASIYNAGYKQLIDGLAHNKAYHHVKPADFSF